MKTSDLVTILPELILALAACLILVVEPLLKKDKTASVAIALTALLAVGRGRASVSAERPGRRSTTWWC